MLNDALEDLGMTTVHMMSFSPTKMSYILTACKQTVINLVPPWDVIATANYKLEENTAFMSPKGTIILHLPADLESVFLRYFLKVLDKDISLIVSAYHTLLAFIEEIETEFNSDLFDIFQSVSAMMLMEI